LPPLRLVIALPCLKLDSASRIFITGCITYFLDQELISYRYSSCCSCCSSCYWGDHLPTSKRLRPRRFKLDRDEIGTIVLQVNRYRLTESRFLYDVEDGGGHHVNSRRKVLPSCRLSAHAASARRIRSSVRQFLIHRTFVLV